MMDDGWDHDKLKSLAIQWLSIDRDPFTRDQIQWLLKKEDWLELHKRLSTRIAFGTAGLRGKMEAGFSRMNAVTVIQASKGLAEYVKMHRDSNDHSSIVIGYDHRRVRASKGVLSSERFAKLAAATFIAANVDVLWLNEYVPTPFVPFAVRRYRAHAGIMITASHNPRMDAGYKVYWANGCQIIPPHDAAIAQEIAQHSNTIQPEEEAFSRLLSKPGLVRHIFDDTLKAYSEAVSGPVPAVPTLESVPTVVFTPMHGVGGRYIRNIVHRALFKTEWNIGSDANYLREVSCQWNPDPAFPTLIFPNPEEKGALDEAMKRADEQGVKLIMAVDPDADRFAAAEKLGDGSWYQFTGNQIGVLFAHFMLDVRMTSIEVEDESEEQRKPPSGLAMLCSTVSTRMLAAMAEREGFEFVETLTGFKWLANVARSLRYDPSDPRAVVFAFEEALGYLFTATGVWDKDGIAASCMFLSACAKWRHEEDIGPYQKLQQLYKRYGCFAEANGYLLTPNPDVTIKVFDEIRQRFNSNAVTKAMLGDHGIKSYRDLTTGYDSSTADNKPQLPVDRNTQMITCEPEYPSSEVSTRFTIRGSGTEPKIKFYIETRVADDMRMAQAEANRTRYHLIQDWFRPAKWGLVPDREYVREV